MYLQLLQRLDLVLKSCQPPLAHPFLRRQLRDDLARLVQLSLVHVPDGLPVLLLAVPQGLQLGLQLLVLGLQPPDLLDVGSKALVAVLHLLLFLLAGSAEVGDAGGGHLRVDGGVDHGGHGYPAAEASAAVHAGARPCPGGSGDDDALAGRLGPVDRVHLLLSEALLTLRHLGGLSVRSRKEKKPNCRRKNESRDKTEIVQT